MPRPLAVDEAAVEFQVAVRAALKARLTTERLVDKILEQVLEVRPVYVAVDLRSSKDDEDD